MTQSAGWQWFDYPGIGDVRSVVRDRDFLARQPQQWKEAYEHLRHYARQALLNDAFYVLGFLVVSIMASSVLIDFLAVLFVPAAIGIFVGVLHFERIAEVMFERRTGISRDEVAHINSLLLAYKVDYRKVRRTNQ